MVDLEPTRKRASFLKATMVAIISLFLALSAFSLRYSLSNAARPPVIVPSTLAQGAYHIHTDESHDGHQSTDDVIEAARQLGLHFVIITDHNKKLWNIEETNGIWVIRGPELSTDIGHVVSLTSEDSPLNILAHPGRRRAPVSQLPPDTRGIELVNPTVTLENLAFSSPASLILTALSYLAEPSVALTSALANDRQTLKLLEGEAHPSLWCAVDAHGLIPARWNLAIWTMTLDLKRDQLSAAALKKALHAGPVGCHSSLVATGQPIDVDADLNGQWTFSLKRAFPFDGSWRVYRDGQPIVTSANKTLTYVPSIPGRYHVEYWGELPGADLSTHPRLIAFRDLQKNISTHP